MRERDGAGEGSAKGGETDRRRPARRLAVALVAEVDGRLRAALPLDGSRAIADPFHRGLDLVELLRVRAAQLADG